MKYLSVFILFFILSGCGDEEMPPFSKLPIEQVEALPSGEKTCYRIADSINRAFPDSATHCSLIKETTGGIFKESYSFYLKTSTAKTAEWNKWGCLAAGKIMSDGANVGMEKIYFKSKPSDKYASAIDAYVCRNLQQKAHKGEIKEFDVLKEFNRRSSLKEM